MREGHLTAPFCPGAGVRQSPSASGLAATGVVEGVDSAQHLPFDQLERLPLQSLLLGQHLLPELEAMAADSLLARFIQRARELGMALYLDDPFNLQDAAQWQDRGMAGRW